MVDLSKLRDPAFLAAAGQTLQQMAWAPVRPIEGMGNPMLEYQKGVQAKATENKTLEWLKANDPEAYQYAQAGLPVNDAFNYAIKKQQEAKAPKTWDYKTLNDGTVIALDPTNPDAMKTVRQGQPKPMATMLTPQEVQQLQLPPGSYQRDASTGKISQIGSQGTTVNIQNKAETAFETELGKKQAASFDALATDGMNARADLAMVKQIETLAARNPTGLGASIKLTLGSFGIPVEGVDEVQALDAAINKLVPTQRSPGSGTMSDRDVELFKSSLPKLINQPGGNQIIIKSMRGMAEYRMKQGEIAQMVMTGQMTREQATKALMSLPNPLADVLSMTPATTQTQGGPPEGIDPDVWDAMPPEDKALWQN